MGNRELYWVMKHLGMLDKLEEERGLCRLSELEPLDLDEDFATNTANQPLAAVCFVNKVAAHNDINAFKDLLLTIILENAKQ